MTLSYDYISNIDSLNFENKSVLIIGAGNIANQYAIALSNMKIKDVTIISKSQESANKMNGKFGFQTISGGYEKNLPLLKKMDLVIVATHVSLLLSATESALESGQTNILVEKPVSIYSKNLFDFVKRVKTHNVRVAYNRMVYPNFILLKQLVENEGGITSCHFTFTEWLNTIDFQTNPSEVYSRWGVSNSLHVISMAMELIGMPKELSPYKFGKLDWHPTGSIFVGSGITEKNIPFSYHANWESAGRWGMEVMTKENAYRLIPLEGLYVCKKNTTDWLKMPFKIAYPNVKQGLAEEIALMLNDDMKQNLVSLEKAAKFVKIAEEIFGYT